MTHIRNLLLVLTLLPLGGVRERSAWAQAPGTSTSAPPAPEGWSELAVVGLTALALLIILVLAVRLYDRSRKREADAIGLQSRLSDALLTDRALQSAIVTLTVHTPMWKRSPLIVEVRGDVPSAGLRDAVLRVVQREATQLKSNVEIEDKLLIVPPRTSRTA
jgi:hypothetical protein